MDFQNEKNHQPRTVVSRLLMSIVIGLLIGMTLTFFIQLANVTDKRVLLAISHISIFILPSLIFGFWHFESKLMNELFLKNTPGFKLLVLGILLLVVSAFFTQYLYSINKLIPLPEWMIEDESIKESLLLDLLNMNDLTDLFVIIFVVACLPAVGEELLFRGIIQKYIERWTKSPWAGIIISAAIFSAIHMQFQGFFPRMFLGILLGYAYWISGSLWLPILIHFINNAVQVVLYFLYDHGLSNIDISNGVEVSWTYGLLSLILTFIIMWLMHQNRPNYSPVDHTTNPNVS